jgi:hypothetical protein
VISRRILFLLKEPVKKEKTKFPKKEPRGSKPRIRPFWRLVILRATKSKATKGVKRASAKNTKR